MGQSIGIARRFGESDWEDRGKYLSISFVLFDNGFFFLWLRLSQKYLKAALEILVTRQISRDAFGVCIYYFEG